MTFPTVAEMLIRSNGVMLERRRTQFQLTARRDQRASCDLQMSIVITARSTQRLRQENIIVAGMPHLGGVVPVGMKNMY